jgi:hypothetical protein
VHGTLGLPTHRYADCEGKLDVKCIPTMALAGGNPSLDVVARISYKSDKIGRSRLGVAKGGGHTAGQGRPPAGRPTAGMRERNIFYHIYL